MPLGHLLQNRKLSLFAVLLSVLASAFDWASTEPGERIFRSRSSGNRQTVRQRHLVLDSIHEDIVSVVRAGVPKGSADPCDAPAGADGLAVPGPSFEPQIAERETLLFAVPLAGRPAGRAPPFRTFFHPTV